jgi:hypothetical protein
MNYGLIEEIFKDPRAYIFGADNVPYVPYQPDGNWEAFLPKYEPQAENYETYCCTVWGTQNAIETLHKRLYGKEPNYSERFTALMAGLDGYKGIDPHITCESIRHDGLVDQDECPIPETWGEFFNRAILTGSLIAKGQYWLQKNEFKHEWLWDKKPDNWKSVLKNAIITSPIGVSVTAWREMDGVYVSDSGGNNHWVMAYKIADYGKYKDCVHIFDSYDHSLKVLHPDHNIRRAKRIWLNKKTPSAMKKHISILQAIINFLTMKADLIDVCIANLGKDASPADLAPDGYACVESVTTLLKKIYSDVPILTYTPTFHEYIRNPRNGFVEIQQPEIECIVLSVTGTGKAGKIGHTGIMGLHGLIMSNNSSTGKWEQNYTMDAWKRKYHDEYGMKTWLYKRA